MIADLVRGLLHAVLYVVLTSLGVMWLVGPGALA